MTIFGRVVRWLRGRPVWAGNRYDPGDKSKAFSAVLISFCASVFILCFPYGAYRQNT